MRDECLSSDMRTHEQEAQARIRPYIAPAQKRQRQRMLRPNQWKLTLAASVMLNSPDQT
jgi:hypothetical protein